MFALIWAFWWLGLVYLHVELSRPPLADQPGLALLWLVGFLYFEILALTYHWQNTLSAVVTWSVRRLSKHKRAFTGWNVIVDIAVAPVALLVLRVFVMLMPGWPGWTLGLSLAVAIAKGLHDHWLRPDLHH